MEEQLKVLNLEAGLGGNRKHWKNVKVTAVEIDPKIAKTYQQLNPEDEIVVGDSHDYLLNNFHKFDFIWSSPPCQSHSKMVKFGRNRKLRYADYTLYEKINFLRTYHTGPWVVENVVPYYKPLIEPMAQLGRHLFWSNFSISDFDVPSPKNFINKTNSSGAKELKDWLGIQFEGNIYYKGNHCPAQVLRNCVHPDLGLHVFNEMKKSLNQIEPIKTI
nr:DNA cytosine methyltransferase [uncultured Allomuricauda sp.]